MKKFLPIALAMFLFACNNNKKTDEPAAADPGNTLVMPANTTPDAEARNSTLTVGGKDVGLNGSILVDKDKKNLKAGAPYRGMITTGSGPGNEGFILRFVFDTKPGTYPVTGMSFNRGDGDNAEQYGGLMGGEEKIYPVNVTLTECKDLGDNHAGGHRWSISGSVENLTIPAMGLMLLDKEKNHPKEVTIDKYRFSNLSFDDNAEEMLEKAMDQLREMNKNKKK